jgi:hypothetical protein
MGQSMHPHDILRLGSSGVAVVLIAVGALGRRSPRRRIRVVLGACQLALTTLILIYAGLLLRTKVQVRSLDPGSSGDASKIAVLALRSEEYGTPEKRRAFFNTIIARLVHVPGIRVDDSGSAVPLAGNVYYAVFFSIGGESPAAQLPDQQRFIMWQGDIAPESLAQEINRAVKTFDRGIHYWHVGSNAPMGNIMVAVFAAYGFVALLFTFIGFRGGVPGSGIAAIATGIPIGIGLAKGTTWYLTPYLFGVSLTDLTTFVVSAGVVAGIVLSASLADGRQASEDLLTTA